VRRHRDEIVDGWALEKFLGEGGNGEVWRAERDGHRAALKILTVRDTKHPAYRRFRDEVEFHRGHEHHGVLPVIDACVPPKLGKANCAWLAMPEATEAEKALRGAPLVSVVEATAAFAETLAALGAKGVSHRDIKPDNLFLHEDLWKVGDWGLVSYPDKDALTRPGRKLGPTWFIAPEMLLNPEDADGRCADVYSLAKTLWVLAAGQKYPATGGTLRRDEPAFRLSSLLTDERADQLERLLEDATAHDPSKRPSMEDVALELHAWLAVKGAFAEGSSLQADDMSDLRRRIEAKTAPGQLAVKERLAWTMEAREYFEPWKGVLERQVLPLIRAGVADASLYNASPNDLHTAGLKGVEDLATAIADTSSFGTSAHSGPIGPVHVILTSLLGQTLIADRPFVRLVAGHLVSHGAQKTLVWSAYRDAPLASALHHSGFIDLIDGLKASARSALEEFAQRIEELTS
jgi:serine/threonine protein kinase